MDTTPSPESQIERGRSMSGCFWRFIGGVPAFTLVAALTTGAVSAQSFEDPESIAWKFGYGLSDAAYSKAWEDYKDEGYLPIDVEMDNGGAIYSGVWQKNT